MSSCLKSPVSTLFRIVSGSLPRRMVDEMDLSRLIDLGVQGHLRGRRTAVYQRATRIIADASEYRGADARRTDYRVWIASERIQYLLKLEECRAREANDLPAL